MSKKKIIIVNNNLNIGGIQKSLVNLLNEIKDIYDIDLLLFSQNGDYLNEIPKEVRLVECKSWYKYLGISQNQCKSIKDKLTRGLLALITKIFGRSFSLKLISKTQKIIEGDYDCAISFLHNGSNNSFYGGCNEFVLQKINAKQKIGWLHCDFALCGANNIQNIKNYLKFDKIVACSQGCLDSFKSCVDIDEKKLFVVGNCSNFKEIKKLANQDTIVYDSSKINIVSVARLSYEKGIDRALNAMAYLKEKGIAFTYHIVGGGPLYNDLVSQTKKLGIQDCVIFYGNQSNPYKYMKNADFLFIPSRHEAAPMVINEALSLGIPILSTSTSSAKVMLIDTGYGIVCENNEDDLKRALFQMTKEKKLLVNLKEKLHFVYFNNKKTVDIICNNLFI